MMPVRACYVLLRTPGTSCEKAVALEMLQQAAAEFNEGNQRRRRRGGQRQSGERSRQTVGRITEKVLRRCQPSAFQSWRPRLCSFRVPSDTFGTRLRAPWHTFEYLWHTFAPSDARLPVPLNSPAYLGSPRGARGQKEELNSYRHTHLSIFRGHRCTAIASQHHMPSNCKRLRAPPRQPGRPTGKEERGPDRVLGGVGGSQGRAPQVMGGGSHRAGGGGGGGASQNLAGGGRVGFGGRRHGSACSKLFSAGSRGEYQVLDAIGSENWVTSALSL